MLSSSLKKASYHYFSLLAYLLVAWLVKNSIFLFILKLNFATCMIVVIFCQFEPFLSHLDLMDLKGNLLKNKSSEFVLIYFAYSTRLKCRKHAKMSDIIFRWWLKLLWPTFVSWRPSRQTPSATQSRWRIQKIVFRQRKILTKMCFLRYFL